MEKSISVIVPMYNVEKYIKLCVDSILAQTFQDFEIILVDDASPDGCVELCQKLYGDNPKVTIIRHEENRGLGESRNTGIKHAVGKYVYFVDSDDFISPVALEKFYAAAEKNNAQVVHASGYYEFTPKGDEAPSEENLKIKWDNYSTEGFLKNDTVYRLENCWKNYHTFANAWLRFCRKDFLEKNQIKFLPIISEDAVFSIALFCAAERYYILHEALYIYRLREDSIMRSFDIKRFSQGIDAMFRGATYIENILEKIPKFNGDEIWRKNFLANFFERFSNTHTAPLYVDDKDAAAANEAEDKTFTPVFGESTPFVKFFFDGYHKYRQQATLLFQQRLLLTNQFKILQSRNQQLSNLIATFISEPDEYLELITALKSDEKKILFMGTPNHGNIGDHAIALGEWCILKNYFPEHKIIEISNNYLMGAFSELLFELVLKKYVRRADIIFGHGGGNLGNLWVNEEQLRRKLIEKFPENKIVIFPQSIYFTQDDDGRKELVHSQKIYNAHKDLHLMTRDENSFALAQKIFPEIHNYLLPDAATVLQGITDDLDAERRGVLFILRHDKEKVRDDNKIRRLQNYLTQKNIPFTVIDHISREKITMKTREEKVRDILLKIRKSKIVVTDRFHGVIFSFITRTPVLAFKSFDTKISSGIKWFKNFPSIFYAEDEDATRMENFIDKYHSTAEEKNSDALNLKVDTDSPQRFVRALDKIFGKGRIYPLELNTPPPFTKHS